MKDPRLKEPSETGWHLTAANLCESPLYEGKALLYQSTIDLTFPLQANCAYTGESVCRNKQTPGWGLSRPMLSSMRLMFATTQWRGALVVRQRGLMPYENERRRRTHGPVVCLWNLLIRCWAGALTTGALY